MRKRERGETREKGKWTEVSRQRLEGIKMAVVIIIENGRDLTIGETGAEIGMEMIDTDGEEMIEMADMDREAIEMIEEATGAETGSRRRLGLIEE